MSPASYRAAPPRVGVTSVGQPGRAAKSPTIAPELPPIAAPGAEPGVEPVAEPGLEPGAQPGLEPGTRRGQAGARWA